MRFHGRNPTLSTASCSTFSSPELHLILDRYATHKTPARNGRLLNHGDSDRDVAVGRVAHLAGLRPQAPRTRDVEAVHGPQVVDREGTAR
jgi:hypothetical protein